MSASQREEARKRAVEKGRQAYLAGVPRTANPYKRPAPTGYCGRMQGEWSQWPAWEMGYNDAVNKAAEKA